MRTRILSILAAVVVCLATVGATGNFRTGSQGAVTAPAAASGHRASASNIVHSAAGPARRTTTRNVSFDVATSERAGLSAEVLRLALGAVTCAVQSGTLAPPPTLTVIDYSRPSIEPRLWVFDLESGDLLFKELVAHGRNTGENMARSFSNAAESRASSLGLFLTGEPYVGSNGYSLRLEGLEPGFNDNARARAIVMHGAPYVDAAFAAAQGRIGRSWGCPALRPAIARQVIDRIRGGSVIFSYYPDEHWLQQSRFLNRCGVSGTLATN